MSGGLKGARARVTLTSRCGVIAGGSGCAGIVRWAQQASYVQGRWHARRSNDSGRSACCAQARVCESRSEARADPKHVARTCRTFVVEQQCTSAPPRWHRIGTGIQRLHQYMHRYVAAVPAPPYARVQITSTHTGARAHVHTCTQHRHYVSLRLVSSALVSSRLLSSCLVCSRLVCSRLVSSRLPACQTSLVVTPWTGVLPMQMNGHGSPICLLLSLSQPATLSHSVCPMCAGVLVSQVHGQDPDQSRRPSPSS